MRSDAELLAAYARSREEEAFAELAARHGATVYRICFRFLGEPHEAEDASQAVFVVLARKAGSLRKEPNLAAWLHGVARNVAARAARSRARRSRLEEEAAMHKAVGPGTVPADPAEASAALAVLDRELAALSVPLRQAVILRYLEDRSQDEAAAVAGCPRGTLARRASDGLERLRQRLAGRGASLSGAALVGVLASEAQATVPSSLLPSLLAVSKFAAAGAAAGAVGSEALVLAKGALKAMFWMKVKVVAAVVAGAVTISTAVPVVMSAMAVGGETLQVGPGKKFDKPSAAIAVAKDGDTIEIDAAGKYDGDVGAITANNLTIRGVGEGRAKIPAAGKHIWGQAIWAIKGKNTTVENIEFSGCRVPDGNGAGIRQYGENLTLRNCKFHDCQDSLMTNNNTPESEILIEHCEFSYCSLSEKPGTHNLYIGFVKKLTYRYNYSHHAKYSNLVKSRAAENHIMYNRITDDADGTGSYELDLCNGGKCYVVGNILHKAANAQNDMFINFGTEGVKYQGSELYVVNNTVVSDYRNGEVEASLVRVMGVAPDFKLVIRNNIVLGVPGKQFKVKLSNWPKAVIEGNFTEGDPLFFNRAAFDFRLQKGSPCIGKGADPGKAGELSLKPEFQYAHPIKNEKRPDDGKLDVGAFEFQEAKP